MTNQAKYFNFILVTLCCLTLGVSAFVYLPGVNTINKPSGQVLGVKEVKAPDLDPVNESKIDFESGQTIEQQIKLDDKTKLLVKLPATVGNQSVERDSKAFYIPCQDNQFNQIQVNFSNGLNAVINQKNSKPTDIKKFINIQQSTLDDKCKLSQKNIAQIQDHIEIRPNTNPYFIEQTTAVSKGKDVDYLLNGDCILSATVKDQVGKYTQKCSLWSLPHGKIYPDLISDKLRDWFKTGDINFFKEENQTPGTLETPFKLVNLDAVKREANIFYIKDNSLKLSDYREVKDINKFNQDFTSRVMVLTQADLTDMFYRKNQLPFFEITSDITSAQIPKQTISCFWTSVTQSEFWYREPIPSMPLTRDNGCNIGVLVAGQKVKGMKIQTEELTSGDAWYLDKNAISFNQNIFKTLQDLGYIDPSKTLCQNQDTQTEFFQRQLCPFGITSLDDLNNLNSKLESTSTKIGSWQSQEVSKPDFSYQVYSHVNQNGLWVYWFKLKNDADLNEKKIELNRIMEKVLVK